MKTATIERQSEQLSQQNSPQETRDRNISPRLKELKDYYSEDANNDSNNNTANNENNEDDKLKRSTSSSSVSSLEDSLRSSRSVFNTPRLSTDGLFFLIIFFFFLLLLSLFFFFWFSHCIGATDQILYYAQVYF